MLAVVTSIDTCPAHVTFQSTLVDWNVTEPLVTSAGIFIAYYRVSTSQQGRSGLGLEAQRAAVAAYLNGGNWKIIEEYTEVESGKRADRPQLEAALKAARIRRAPLVVAKVDRLTRSVGFLSRLLEAGVDVRFADLPQIQGPTGRFMLQQMASVAELEAGMISARTRAALAAAKARGQKLGGTRVRKSDGKRVLLSAEARGAGTAVLAARAAARAADIAPTIEALRNSGTTSLRAIATALNEAGISTARGGGKWSAVQVKRTLSRLKGDDSYGSGTRPSIE
jgi:DNA invertase Pin-like site-specific DNA recombinase